MSDLAALIARVRGASGPDDGLNIDLCIALGYIGYVDAPLNLRRADDDAGWLDYESVEDGHTVQCTDVPPDLTGSIDTALALVERLLPDWMVALGSHNENNLPWACLTEPEGECRDFTAEAVTIPLAIIEATLTALLSTQESPK